MAEASYFYCYDGQGNVLAVTDANGVELTGYQYSAFGELLEESGELEVDNPIRWNGRWGYYYDSDFGEYHVRARRYEPALARWTSCDLIDYWLDERRSQYAYAANSPTSSIDLTGYAPYSCTKTRPGVISYVTGRINARSHALQEVFVYRTPGFFVC